MINTHHAGLFGGLFLGGWHLLWSLLVLSGIAQAIYDFILWAHMIHLAVIIGPFDIGAAATLVVITSVAGYIVGWISAALWNRVQLRSVTS